MAKLKITAIGTKNVELQGPNGEIVNVGYRKNMILLMRLQSKKVGEEVDLEIKQSDVALGYSGNHYVDMGDDFALAELKAKQFLVQNKLVENQMASLGI